MTDRREFLRTITLASGAVFLGMSTGCGRPDDLRRVAQGSQQFKRAHAILRDRQTMPTPERITSSKVCIVGAGFSGTTAAWLLAQQGIECVMLESESVVGGCARTYMPSNVDQRVPLGNVYFVERSETLDAMAKHVGIPIRPCPDDVYYIGGKMYTDIWSDTDIRSVATSTADADGMKKFRDDVLGLSDEQLPRYPLQTANLDVLRRYDGQTAVEFIRGYASPTLTMLLDAYARSSMGAGLADVNAYCLLNFYSDEFGASFDGGRWIMQGGTSDLLTGVAAALPDVRTDRLAFRIEQRPSGWSVFAAKSDGATERIDAEHVILSSPLFSSRALLRNSGMQQAGVIPALTYAPYMTIHMHSSEALTPLGSYDTWHLPAGERYTDLISTTDGAVPPNAEGIWTSAYAPLPVHRRAELMDEPRVANIANATADAVLERLGLPSDAVDAVYAWSWGHGVVIPTVGSHQSMIGLASAMPDGLHLACTDVDAAPCIESAVSAAERAVSRIMG